MQSLLNELQEPACRNRHYLMAASMDVQLYASSEKSKRRCSTNYAASVRLEKRQFGSDEAELTLVKSAVNRSFRRLVVVVYQLQLMQFNIIGSWNYPQVLLHEKYVEDNFCY